MKVMVLTHGTRGDVQPFAALACALKLAGHSPIFVAPERFHGLVEPHGIPAVAIYDAFSGFARDPVVSELYERNFRGLRGAHLTVRYMHRCRREIGRAIEDLASVADHGAELVVHLPNIPGHALAERLGVPSIAACLQPGWIPTDSFPNPLIHVPLPRRFSKDSYAATRLWVRAQTGSTRKWRRKALGLPHRPRHTDPFRKPDGSPATVLQAFSRHILPPQTHYPEPVHTTGFWFLPAPSSWQPPAQLADFLDAGDPPVCMGFGSVTGSDPARTGRVIAETVERAEVRAVVVTGWGGIEVGQQLGDNVHVVDDVPFDWLFPRVSAVVHHGGVGTIGAALASGRPQVVCPFMYEQPFTAQRMQALGVAPGPLPQSGLTTEDLSVAIRRVLSDPTFSKRAELLAERVRLDDGVGTAVKIIESQG